MHRGPVGPKRSGQWSKKTGDQWNGYPKEGNYQRVKSGGAVGDDMMEKAEAWTQAGAGVDDSILSVGATPNENIMKSIDEDTIV